MLNMATKIVLFLSRIDGREAVELEIYKSADANIVQVSQILKNV